jgi:hypothetical protein
MKRDRSFTGSVSWETWSRNFSSAALIAPLPFWVYRCDVFAATRSRARSVCSCARACALFAASFEPVHCGRGWEAA